MSDKQEVPPAAERPAGAVVVVTGGGSGFGAALARALVARGSSVVIAGRDRQRLDAVCADADPDRLHAVVCDVTRPGDLDRLWAEAVARHGRVDHWINNAGVGAARRPLTDTDPEDVERVLATNLLGALLGARCALRGMREQGRGHVWATEGLGSDGPLTPGTTSYSASKAGVTRGFGVLVEEAKGTGVRIGFLRPGIMPTAVTLGDGRVPVSARERRLIDVLGDDPEDVAAAFARGVLARPRNGARLTWLTRRRIAWRLLTAPLGRRHAV